jgi:hypothetical protein
VPKYGFGEMVIAVEVQVWHSMALVRSEVVTTREGRMAVDIEVTLSGKARCNFYASSRLAGGVVSAAQTVDRVWGDAGSANHSAWAPFP